MVAFTEGREAANPFWPSAVPVDAYCSLIVDSIERPFVDTFFENPRCGSEKRNEEHRSFQPESCGHARRAGSALPTGASRVVIAENCVVTPSARDFLPQHNIALAGATGNCSARCASIVQPAPAYAVGGSAGSQRRQSKAVFTRPKPRPSRRKYAPWARKLWMRQFVDGNGGNISYRIGPNEVICTPTLVSKFDLTPEDLSLVDLEGNQIAGTKPRTSEIFLHLEIYKAVPEAKSWSTAIRRMPPRMPSPAASRRIWSSPSLKSLSARLPSRLTKLRERQRLPDRSALCEGAQHGAALQSRHHLLGRHGYPCRVVCRSA